MTTKNKRRMMVDRDALIKAFYNQCLLPGTNEFFNRDDFSFCRIREIILTAVAAENIKSKVNNN